MDWGLPGIMQLDPAGQELWHSGKVKAGGTPNPGRSEGGVRTSDRAVAATTVSATPYSNPSSGPLPFMCTNDNESGGRSWTIYEGLTLRDKERSKRVPS